MTAAVIFLRALRQCAEGHHAAGIRVTLHGSSSFTGKGPATDRTPGLLGWLPAELDPETERQFEALRKNACLRPSGLPAPAFDPAVDIVFDYGPPLPGHANGLVFSALDSTGAVLLADTYYPIGGGFVVTAAERNRSIAAAATEVATWPYPFKNAAEMLRMARDSLSSIAAMKRENELHLRTSDEIEAGPASIRSVMNGCIERGLNRDGELPGGLHVRRRAGNIYQQLLAEQRANSGQPHAVADCLSVYAMAVNEENAAGGKVATAPTNGAADVVPAVLRYYLDHCHGAEPAKVPDFLLTAAAIGGLIKHNASISGAEAGCQGEVGSAAAMAAAGLCAVLGGTPEQIENAAEIALEHHLGMTCDPVAGLVQVRCIERNGIAATKAVASASLALRGDGWHFMPLDNCIEAMRQTGEEMSTKFKETSQGGLAVNLPGC